MALLGGKYELVRQLGQGGMGAVFEGRNAQTGKRVAVKTLISTLAESPDAVQRFLREARAASAIEHVGVLQVYDVGVDDGAPYIVMELLQGEDLEAYLRRAGPADPRSFYATVALALGALATAHRAQIVHRDLKPGNIFLARVVGAREIIPKLLDFGISKLNVDGELGLTKSRAILGTPLFMSPEQVMGSKHVTLAADIYSLGVIFYHALSGTFPVQADTLGGLIAALLSEAPVSLHVRRPDLSPAVCDVVMRCLAKNPNDRFGSVEEFIVAYAGALGDPDLVELAALPGRESVSPVGTVPGRAPASASIPATLAPPMVLGGGSVPGLMATPGPISYPVPASPVARPPRNLALVLGVTLALLGVGGLGIGVGLMSGSSTAQPAAAGPPPLQPHPSPVAASTSPGHGPDPAPVQPLPSVVHAPLAPAVAVVPAAVPTQGGNAPSIPDAGLRTPSTRPGQSVRVIHTSHPSSSEPTGLHDGAHAAPPSFAPGPGVTAPPQGAPPTVYHRVPGLNANEF